MKNIKYSIGIDYGSESGRVLIVNITTGEIKGMQVIPYRHGVITETLPNSSKKIPKGSALQHPNDYIEVLEQGIPLAISKAGIKPEQIIGLGIDVTSSTLITVDETLKPLCLHKEWQDSHHAWLKLWKHHHTKTQTEKIYKLATQRKEKWMRRLGYNISEEWAVPKMLEVFEDAPDVYNATTYFIEAVDWLVSILTSTLIRNNCSLGFKTFWSETDGFPEEFFKELNLEFGSTILSKLDGEIKNIGTCAGFLSKEWSEKLSLPGGIARSNGDY
ncbi:FGGY family carbohydrate kinase [Bacillus sp. T3]|uniref:FGGY family carbohydrate kinase n=1 Tax=Bacillus sp. T3 TaxID=467262 RepID=UPI0029815A39|nr:FGGY family carbohydrate kinase [Bacillus sp. T3]